MDLALNNRQRLICHKQKKTTNQPTNNLYTVIWFLEFISNTNTSTIYLFSWNLTYLIAIITICLHIVIIFHIFLGSTNHFQTDFFDPLIGGPEQVLRLRLRIDFEVMAKVD